MNLIMVLQSSLLVTCFLFPSCSRRTQFKLLQDGTKMYNEGAVESLTGMTVFSAIEW